MILCLCLLLGFSWSVEGFCISTKCNPPERVKITRQNLFNMPKKMTPSKSVSNKSWIVCEDETMLKETLCFEKITFPYVIELQENSKESSSGGGGGGYPSPSELLQNMISVDDDDDANKNEEIKEGVTKKRLILRHLEDEDLPVALRLIIRE